MSHPRQPRSVVTLLLLLAGGAVAFGVYQARQNPPRTEMTVDQRDETSSDGASSDNVTPVAAPRQLKLEDIPVDGRRAYGYLKQVCDLGPRPSGSEAMKKQQAILEKHFADHGATVRKQEAIFHHPLTGAEMPMVNLLASWQPAKQQRILLCAHYDTRPFPDLDPTNPKGVFVGANDGGSGVAVLMELAHHMQELTLNFGVDFCLFDAEEFVFTQPSGDKGHYFIGSQHFASAYAERKDKNTKYRWGVLLDMVGDANLEIYHELNSVRWHDTRPLVFDIWNTAKRLGVPEFISRSKHEIRDDHLPLHATGKIPICDIIDFDYPHWHTTGDTPDKCSALSLAKVGWVVLEWMKKARQ